MAQKPEADELSRALAELRDAKQRATDWQRVADERAHANDLLQARLDGYKAGMADTLQRVFAEKPSPSGYACWPMMRR